MANHIFLHICTEPEMADLLVIVIPLIKAEWEDVAYVLGYDIHLVEAIGLKHQNNPHRCCRELFIDWLTSDHGIKSKTWSGFLNEIGKLSHLAAAKEKIMKELETGSTHID